MSKFPDIETNENPACIPFRVFVIGLALALLNTYWVATNDLVIGPLHNYMSLFSNAIFTLFVLILLNFVLKKLLPKTALSDSDLLVVYVMVVMVTTVSGHTSMNKLVGTLAHPFWFDSEENDWRNLFWRHIPDWFAIQDKNVLRGFYLGETSFFSQQFVKAWIVPMLCWSAFMFVLYFVLICINTIIRRQFTDHERLTYPITWMPLEMGRDTTAFLKSKLMWVGFGIAAGISLLNGLHVLYPAVPSIRVGWQYFNFPDKPWSYMRGTLISFQPFVIGLSFFMPLDLAFSAWFFYIFKKMTLILMGVAGWRNLYFDEQAQGAWTALGILALWVGRKHLKQVIAQVVTGKAGIDDSRESMSYRAAILGIIGGVLFFLWFAYSAGFSFWVILLFLGLYCCGAIGLTKVRASLGVAVHELLWVDPGRTMVTSIGTRAYGPRNLTILNFFYWLNRDQPAHPMPNQLEAFRIGEQSNINVRQLVWAMLITLAVCIPVTFLIYLNIEYREGASSSRSFIQWVGVESFGRRLQPWLTLPTGPDFFTIGAMGLGFGITTVLLIMKMRFLWWPFHPVGYVLGVSPAEMVYIWVPVLISWSCKLAILRYGGLRAYRRAIPFFAGLILGDYSMGCIWSIISAVFNISTYNMAWHGR